MKRTADQAFAPSGAALFDPKAYFAQYCQQAAATGQAPAPAGVAPATAAPVRVAAAVASQAAADTGEKSEVHKQVEEASAVRCAAIVKEKGDKFTTRVQLAALHTMANKSSWHLRAELIKQPHVRRLFERVAGVLRRPPTGLDMETQSRTAWDLLQFPEEVQGDRSALLGATAQNLGASSPDSWKADQASKVLYCLAKAEVIQSHKPLVSKIVAEIIADKGRRVKELSHEGLVNLLWAVARARQHLVKGDHPTVHTEENDQTLLDMATKRVTEELEKIDVKHLAELVHVHNDIGIRNEALFKAMCPRIIAKQKELNEKTMGKVIKAYTRFMIPLKEEAQGFRTMAVVAKGDFIRPSDKPAKTTKKTYDHPVSLYGKTQLHGRG